MGPGKSVKKAGNVRTESYDRAAIIARMKSGQGEGGGATGKRRWNSRKSETENSKINHNSGKAFMV